MGPLVPEIISSEFNLIIAIVVGFGFGFALEQAGFSSTKKLVGLFYGYDFTVLKVFFTAGITAMIGVLILSHIGLLDIDLIYVNPTFLWSAIIGGLIMGGGFIIGGFCPGTSVCAAAIGKIDAMLFIAGSFIGIFIFTEGYPFFEKLYLAKNMGPLTMNGLLGTSKIVFALLMSLMAVGAFFFTAKIQNKVNDVTPAYSRKTVFNYSLLSIIPFIAILYLALSPSKHERILNKISEARRQKKCVFKEISSDKLAYELMHNYYKINLIDVRSPESFKKYHLPLAINIPLDSMFNREWEDIFNQKVKTNVFYADEDTTAKKACLLAKHIGKSKNYILSETTYEFKSLIFDAKPPAKHANKQEVDEYNFRVQTSKALIDLRNSLKNFNQPVKKKLKKAKGGCV